MIFFSHYLSRNPLFNCVCIITAWTMFSLADTAHKHLETFSQSKCGWFLFVPFMPSLKLHLQIESWHVGHGSATIDSKTLRCHPLGKSFETIFNVDSAIGGYFPSLEMFETLFSTYLLKSTHDALKLTHWVKEANMEGTACSPRPI